MATRRSEREKQRDYNDAGLTTCVLSIWSLTLQDCLKDSLDTALLSLEHGEVRALCHDTLSIVASPCCICIFLCIRHALPRSLLLFAPAGGCWSCHHPLHHRVLFSPPASLMTSSWHVPLPHMHTVVGWPSSQRARAGAAAAAGRPRAGCRMRARAGGGLPRDHIPRMLAQACSLCSSFVFDVHACRHLRCSAEAWPLLP